MTVHVVLALTGAGLWATAVLFGRPVFFYGACAALVAAAVSGPAVFSRWLPRPGRHARPGTDGRTLPTTAAIGHFAAALLTLTGVLLALLLRV